MERFYPKNFVLWRPYLLLLLIFLEVVYDATGLFTGGGEYLSSCRTDSDCQQEFICDKLRHECFCRNNINSQLRMFYDKSSKTCLSGVGKRCTLPKRAKDDDGLWTINCVPYAQCIPQKGLPDILGVCKCITGFEETVTHLCRPSMVIQIGDDRPVISMARQVGPPIEERMSSSAGQLPQMPQSDSSKSKSDIPAEGTNSNPVHMTNTAEDKNTDIVVRKDVLDDWEAGKGASHYSSVHLCIGLTTIILLIVR